MKEIKNITVNLRKDGHISLNLDQGVKMFKLPISQKELLAYYAMFHADEKGANTICECMERDLDLPWPMNKVKINKHEDYNPIRSFKDVVYTLNYYKTQIQMIIAEYEEGNEIVQSAVV